MKEKGHFVQFQSIRIKSLKPKCVRLHRQINYNSNVPNKPQMTWTSNCECNLRKFMTNEKIICHAELVSASYQWSVLTSSSLEFMMLDSEKANVIALSYWCY